MKFQAKTVCVTHKKILEMNSNILAENLFYREDEFLIA